MSAHVVQNLNAGGTWASRVSMEGGMVHDEFHYWDAMGHWQRFPMKDCRSPQALGLCSPDPNSQQQGRRFLV